MFLNFDPEFAQVSKRLDGLVTLPDFEAVAPEHLQARGLIVRLGTTLSADRLAQFPDLRFVATVTTGLDHIDMDWCAANGVRVLTLKGETQFLNRIRATPEHTWGLLLSLMRKTPSAHAAVCERSWDRTRFFGNELFGKTLGIIGYGRVGRILARYALAFDMRVLAFDSRNDCMDDPGVSRVSLEQLLATADVVSVHLALTAETEHFLKREHFTQMARKPWLINTARGRIVDEAAMLEALEQGWIRGAAVDVLANETRTDDWVRSEPLIDYARRHDNLLLTPHIAGSTHESMADTALFIEDKIVQFEAQKLTAGKRAIVFDWDGTLFDSMAYKRQNFVDMFAHSGVDPQSVHAWHVAHGGIPRIQLFSRANQTFHGALLDQDAYDAMSADYSRRNVAAGANAELFADARQSLPQLAEHFRLFVSSSSVDEELQAVVDAQAVRPFFAEVCGSRPGFSKGEEHIAHFCAQYQLKREEILFVGDDFKDVELARRAGVDVVRVRRQSKHGKLKSLTELL